MSTKAVIKTWELGKQISVNFTGDEEEIIGKILEMEERDINVNSSTSAKEGIL